LTATNTLTKASHEYNVVAEFRQKAVFFAWVSNGRVVRR
jgi:hypothetical protein